MKKKQHHLRLFWRQSNTKTPKTWQFLVLIMSLGSHKGKKRKDARKQTISQSARKKKKPTGKKLNVAKICNPATRHLQQKKKRNKERRDETDGRDGENVQMQTTHFHALARTSKPTVHRLPRTILDRVPVEVQVEVERGTYNGVEIRWERAEGHHNGKEYGC